MTIRRATPADARAIAEVHIASWRVGYRGLVSQQTLDRLDVDERTELWRELIADVTVLVAEDGEELVASVAFRESSGEIGALYVRPDHFRQGIGSRLLAATHAALREHGCKHAELWVFAANHDARAFYAAHGYAPDGATDRHFGVPTVRLRAPLEPAQRQRRPG